MKMLFKRAKRSKTEMVTTTYLSGILGSESITEAREKRKKKTNHMTTSDPIHSFNVATDSQL